MAFPRTCTIPVEWKAYQRNAGRLPHLVSSASQIRAVTEAYLLICDQPEGLDTHATESLRVIQACLTEALEVCNANGLKSSHVQRMYTVGCMVSQLSTRCSYIYQTSWCHHVQAVVDKVTNSMRAVIRTKRVGTRAETQYYQACASLFVHDLILDQLRYDCWTGTSLTTFRRWADTMITYSQVCIAANQTTTIIAPLKVCCEILIANVESLASRAKPHVAAFQDHRCGVCQSQAARDLKDEDEDEDEESAYRIRQSTLTLSCRHKTAEAAAVMMPSIPTGLNPVTPMLDQMGRYANGVTPPPPQWQRLMHRQTVITLRLMIKHADRVGSGPAVRGILTRAQTACAHIQTMSAQFPITFRTAMGLFGTSATVSHQAQALFIEVLRSIQVELKQHYHQLGTTGDNVRAVIWYLTAMVIPIATQAYMWDGRYKTYALSVLHDIDNDHDYITPTRTVEDCKQELASDQYTHQDHTTEIEEQEQEQKDSIETYTICPSNAARTLAHSGNWNRTDTKAKFLHRLKCNPCVYCHGPIRHELYATTNGEEEHQQLQSLCSVQCVTKHFQREKHKNKQSTPP
jgi:hypothetical protein